MHEPLARRLLHYPGPGRSSGSRIALLTAPSRKW